VEVLAERVSRDGNFSLPAAVARFDVVELSVVAEANMASLSEQSGTGSRVGAGSLPAMDSISKYMPYALLAITSMSSPGLTRVQQQTSVQNSYMDAATAF
jgi:hypothetical protein